MLRFRRPSIALLVCLGLLLAAPAAAEQITVSDNPEEFRTQMLDFLTEMEEQLLRARQYPAFTETFNRSFGYNASRTVPDEAYNAVWDIDYDNLVTLRNTIALVPEFLDIPNNLGRVLDALPPAADFPEVRAHGTCKNNAEEFRNIERLTTISNNLKTSANALAIAFSVAGAADAVADAATGECEIVGAGLVVCVCIPIPTSWIQTFTVIAKGVLETAQLSVSLAADELDFQIVDSEQCIDSCLKDVDSVDTGDPNPEPYWRKGCDNRDNNCNKLIDEPGEDKFDPIVTVDASLSGRCFRDATKAADAVAVAFKAADDCTGNKLRSGQGLMLTPDSIVPDATTCMVMVEKTATDASGNSASAATTFFLDDMDPLIGPLTVAPGTCFGSVSAAEMFLATTTVTDCTLQRTGVRADEKECIADLELSAEDLCGNESTARVSVRIDDTPPDVKIDVLSLPSVDGLSCFDSTPNALATVTEATEFGDDCSDAAGLSFSTTVSGDACNLQITQQATDECLLSSSDSLVVRVDDEPPTVSCSLVDTLLWPADMALHDVGLSIVAADNCDGSTPRIEVGVTSDEPTELAFNSINVGDPHPDAVIERNPDGTFRVLVRAQRRGAMPNTIEDGRVYRIRVTATDSCGLSSYTDCFVQVPVDLPPLAGVGRAVNSGQIFDATRVN